MDIFQAIEDENLEAIDLFIFTNLNINTKSSWGDTPLIYAVLSNNYEIVKKLINAGAKLETKNADSITALRCAVEMSYATIVDLLIDNGANINAKDRKGNTILMEAILRGNIKIIEKILDKNPNINPDSKTGLNPLQVSIRCRLLEVTKMLIQKGASLSENSIVDAISSGCINMVKFVIESGIDIDKVRLSNGNTSLMSAIWMDNTEICKMLIEAGADLSLRNNEGKTALDYAIQHNRDNIQNLIRSRSNI